MKCYYHLEKDAVALCNSCNRALCHDCAVDVHPGTACKNRCEKDVQATNILTERSKSVFQKAGKTHRGYAMFSLLIGIIFTGIGSIPLFIDISPVLFLVAILGLVFLLGAYSSYRSARSFEEITDDAEKEAETN